MNEKHYSAAFDGKSSPIGEITFYEHRNSDVKAGTLHFSDDVLLDTIRGIPYGDILLDAAAFRGLRLNLLRGRFIEDASGTMRRTREASRRENDPNGARILFGQLVMTSATDYEAVEAVAVKPFDSARLALHEHLVMDYLNTIAPPPRAHSSFKTLGFYAYPDSQQTGIITQYDETVISYDNLFWNPLTVPLAQLDKALAACGLGLGYLHAHALSYSDASVKNAASGNYGIRHIDMESAQTMRSRDGTIDPDVAIRSTRANIVSLIRSIGETSNYADLIDRSFAPMYVSMVSRPGSLLPEACRLTVPDVRQMLAL